MAISITSHGNPSKTRSSDQRGHSGSVPTSLATVKWRNHSMKRNALAAMVLGFAFHDVGFAGFWKISIFKSHGKIAKRCLFGLPIMMTVMSLWR